jgi:hypothetical protein
VAGKVYNGSVWVKPAVVGQTIILRVREMVGTTSSQTGMASLDTEVTTSTSWVQLTASKTASASGNSIHFEVYSENIAAGSFFNADLMSLTRQ